MKGCEKGYKPSTSDSHGRCVRVLNASVCKKQGKEFSTQTRKCRKPCRKNEERVMRSDKNGRDVD